MQQLGINLSLYVPDPEHLQSRSWEDALEWPQMRRLTQHWHKNMYLPMRAMAAPASGAQDCPHDAWGAQQLRDDASLRCLLLCSSGVSLRSCAASSAMILTPPRLLCWCCARKVPGGRAKTAAGACRGRQWGAGQARHRGAIAGARARGASSAWGRCSCSVCDVGWREQLTRSQVIRVVE